MAELSVKLEPFGPTPQAVRELVRGLPRRPDVQAQLKGTRNRMLSFRLLEPETKEQARPALPNAYEATFFDYTNNRAVLVRGGLRAKRVDVSESGTQPLPSQAEFDEALAILREDHELGPVLREQAVQPYQAMPPLLDTELPDGRIARTIAVGFLPLRRTRVRHEIVGVNLITKEVIRFADRAPATAVAHNPICGLPYGTSPPSGPTTPGLAWVTVSQGGTVLWRFQVVRPAMSSGPERLGG